jgi:HD-GYP domain-containing protein (c-di-GMP phosphodiesterase class II)
VAVDEIERCAGTQFDPAVVAAFRDAYAELARADRLPRAA